MTPHRRTSMHFHSRSSTEPRGRGGDDAEAAGEGSGPVGGPLTGDLGRVVGRALPNLTLQGWPCLPDGIHGEVGDIIPR